MEETTTSPTRTEETKESNHLHIRLLSSNGEELHFKIKKTLPLSKVFDAYYNRTGVKPESVRFLFDGMRVNSEQTAESLGMEDHDVIDVLLSQTGGIGIENYIDYNK
jgi:small ubiquitin-related modifier